MSARAGAARVVGGGSGPRTSRRSPGASIGSACAPLLGGAAGVRGIVPEAPGSPGGRDPPCLPTPRGRPGAGGRVAGTPVHWPLSEPADP